MIQRGKEPEWAWPHSGSFPRPVFRAFFVKLRPLGQQNTGPYRSIPQLARTVPMPTCVRENLPAGWQVRSSPGTYR